MTVLIVEHNPLVALDLTEMIGEMGITRIFVVTNEREARKVAQEQPVTIALLDVNIRTGQDSAALALHLASQNNTKIIYLVNDTTTSSLRRAQEINPFSIIGKPFSDEEITDAVKLAMISDDGTLANS
ncbi:MAG: response regulator [Cyclobacteriaceae bacterium]